MAQECKLVYFNARSLGEPARYLLAYTGVAYEDVRVPMEKWVEMKKETPFGLLPYLEIDGRRVSQSSVICRYIAQQHNLTGKDAFQSIQCDEIAASIFDLVFESRGLFISTPEALELRLKASADQQFFLDNYDAIVKEDAREKFIKETLPFYYEKYDNIIKKNGGNIVGNSLTWADIFLAHFVDQFSVFAKTDVHKSFSNLNALKNKVLSLPGIKEWIKKRPVTVF